LSDRPVVIDGRARLSSRWPLGVPYQRQSTSAFSISSSSSQRWGPALVDQTRWRPRSVQLLCVHLWLPSPPWPAAAWRRLIALCGARKDHTPKAVFGQVESGACSRTSGSDPRAAEPRRQARSTSRGLRRRSPWSKGVLTSVVGIATSRTNLVSVRAVPSA
jgi:hypothetical protein